ncbi:MAG: hypothetical protein QOG98_2674, partial [Pseudonocardiales bacterium]|nr:hypothetical protein [Pseudonocardiales bacterium]
SIIEMLRDDTVSSAERWEQARRALTDFAQAAASASPSTQRQFWKRRDTRIL